jgi:hypothetical protein
MSEVKGRPSDAEVDVGKSSDVDVEKSSAVEAGELPEVEVEKTDERTELRSEVNESNKPPPPVACGVVEVAEVVVVTSLPSLVVVDELLSPLSDEAVVGVGSIKMLAMHHFGPT